VTNGSLVIVNKMTVTNGSASAYSFSGSGTIHFSGDEPEVLIAGSNNNSSTNVVSVTCKVEATVLTKTGGGRLNLNNTNNAVGQWIVTQGAIAGAASGSLPADSLFGTGIPATLVTNFIVLDNGAGIGFSATGHGSFSVGTNRGIYLASGGGKIGGANANAVITFDGPITGPGDLNMPNSSEWPGGTIGANVVYLLSNTNNDWAGQTRVTIGELRLGNNQVLPATTTLYLTNTGSSDNGRLDLNGFNQTIVKVVLDSLNNSRISDTVGTGSLFAEEFDLHRSKSSSIHVSAVLAGSGFLRKSTSGTITMSGVNTYTGDTLIEGGTLALTNSGSFDYSTNISISAGATLNVTGRTDGTLNLGSAQILSGDGSVTGTVSVSGTLKPGAGVGILSTGPQTWNSGGSYVCEINNSGNDLVVVSNLAITATSESKFSVDVTALESLAGWDNTVEHSWVILSSSNGITGFSPDKFTITDHFSVSNSAGSSSFWIGLANDGNDLVLHSTPFKANADNRTRESNKPLKIDIASLMTNDFYNPTLSISVNLASDTSEQGGTLVLSNGWIYYTPVGDPENDSFSYVLSDGTRTDSATVNIAVQPDIQGRILTSASPGAGSFFGVPETTYTVEYSDELDPPSWQMLTNVTTGANGAASFSDPASPLPPQRYYRIVYP
jgi:autotransporter-associated beta strand protein